MIARTDLWIWLSTLDEFQLAAILLDTQNLKSASAQLSMTRDSEAVQLLLVGSNSNYRNALFDECMLFCPLPLLIYLNNDVCK